jgi:hypothetical protein
MLLLTTAVRTRIPVIKATGVAPPASAQVTAEHHNPGQQQRHSCSGADCNQLVCPKPCIVRISWPVHAPKPVLPDDTSLKQGFSVHMNHVCFLPKPDM